MALRRTYLLKSCCEQCSRIKQEAENYRTEVENWTNMADMRGGDHHAEAIDAAGLLRPRRDRPHHRREAVYRCDLDGSPNCICAIRNAYSSAASSSET